MSRADVSGPSSAAPHSTPATSTSSPDPAAERAALARAAWTDWTRLFFGPEMHDRFHEAAERAGVPHPGALKALMGLDPDAPRSMRSLADDMRCDASYITNLVDALEDLGYVERQVSPIDRRVKLVHLTPAGRQAQESAHAVITTPPRALDRLTVTELRSLARLMAKLV
jgi:DNA-binding MarR family transcriptional regulator